MAVAPKRPLRVPHTRPTKITLDTRGASSGGGGTWIVIVLILLIVFGAIGTYFYINRDRFFAKEEPEEEYVPPPKPKLKPAETKVVEPEPEPEPEPEKPKQKTVAELKAEADAAQKALDAKIAEAKRQSVGKELPGFAGAKFGAVVKGSPISTEKLPGPGDLATSGYGVSLRGPTLKSPFRSFGNVPIVWVTPKTYTVYKIEFSRSMDRTPGPLPDPDTTNLVAVLAKKLRRDPLSLDHEKYPLARREFVFPFGATTLTVSEPGGERQCVTVVNEALYPQAKAESEELRKEGIAKEAKVKTLSSDKYPSAGAVKMSGARLQKGTIRHFCGLSFGALAPYGAKVSRPLKGECAFFIDYRKAKCRPFMNFEHGRAIVGRENGAICAIELHSEGAADGLTDAEYYAKVRRTLEGHYQVKPRESVAEGVVAKVVYALGDVEITLAPDPLGGFMLRAENTVYKALFL